MKPFTESARYEYDLAKNSLVVDIGAHTGIFAEGIASRYPCRVFGYEPVQRFREQAEKRLARFGDRVRIFPLGVGARTMHEMFAIKGDMTGRYAEGEPCEVGLISVKSLFDLALQSWPAIDLMKINVEGMEYEILDEMLALDLAKHVRNIQVQFHSVVPDAQARHDSIRERLLTTHCLTYDAPWVWSNYALIQKP